MISTAHCGARARDPDFESFMFCRLRQPGFFLIITTIKGFCISKFIVRPNKRGKQVNGLFCHSHNPIPSTKFENDCTFIPRKELLIYKGWPFWSFCLLNQTLPLYNSAKDMSQSRIKSILVPCWYIILIISCLIHLWKEVHSS